MRVSTRPKTTTGIADVVAANIRAEMARHMTEQKDIGLALGLSPAAVSNRYIGITPWRLDELETVASVIGVSVYDLLPRRDSNLEPSD